jgi:hypothetical protein
MRPASASPNDLGFGFHQFQVLVVAMAAVAVAVGVASGEEEAAAARCARRPRPRPHSVTISEFGAVGDGVTVNTLPFQNAIFYLRSFADKGGAQLYVPRGRWLTGSFNLTSHLTIFLEKDAVIIGAKVVLLLLVAHCLHIVNVSFWLAWAFAFALVFDLMGLMDLLIHGLVGHHHIHLPVCDDVRGLTWLIEWDIAAWIVGLSVDFDCVTVEKGIAFGIQTVFSGQLVCLVENIALNWFLPYFVNGVNLLVRLPWKMISFGWIILICLLFGP